MLACAGLLAPISLTAVMVTVRTSQDIVWWGNGTVMLILLLSEVAECALDMLYVSAV